MKLEKLTYIIAKKTNLLFKDFYLIKLEITFLKQNQYIIFCFKYNKTYMNYIEILILLVITTDFICFVIALCFLFICNFQPPNTFLFAFINSLFFRHYIIQSL